MTAPCPPDGPAAADRWLVFAHEATNSGAPRALLEVLDAVRATRGPAWSCEILLARGGPLAADFARFGPVHPLIHRWADGRRRLARLLDRLVDRPFLQPRRLAGLLAARPRAGPGLVYVNSGTNGRWMPALRALGRPVLTQVHELEYSLRRFSTPAELRAVLRGTDQFIAVSSAVADDLAGLGVPPDRVTRVPNFLRALPPAADVSAARRALAATLGLPDGTRFVCGCGHIDGVKGPDLFVDLARALAVRRDPPVFLWLGAAHDRALARRLRRAVDRGGLRGRVRFLGAVDDPAAHFAASEFVAVTSRIESFSRVALEAGALGRPVLAFAAARGPADLLPPDCLVGALDGDAMAAAATRWLDHPDEAGRSGAELRAAIGEGFLASRWINTVLAVAAEVSHV